MLVHLIVRYFLYYISIYLERIRNDTLSADARIEALAKEYELKLEKEIAKIRSQQAAQINKLAELRSYIDG